MAKTKKLNVDSVDYTPPAKGDSIILNKSNLQEFVKKHYKLLIVFSGFIFLFILGLILTIIGLTTRPIADDLGGINSASTTAVVGLIFLLFSSLVVILIIPISFRALRKKQEKKKSEKIIRNR